MIKDSVLKQLFSLKTPCNQCPFRSDGKGIRLNGPRAAEIIKAISAEQRVFSCHKTHIDPENGRGWSFKSYCAGAMIFLHKNGMINEGMAAGMYYGFFDPNELDMTAPVFDSPDAMINWHAHSQK